MSLNGENKNNDEREIFEKYHETFYEDLHGWRNYGLTSTGYGILDDGYNSCLFCTIMQKINLAGSCKKYL